MLKLYEFSITRSVRCKWLLKELNVPYESIEVNLLKREHLKDEFLAINPSGKVPVLIDEGFTLSESAAICTYLANKFPEKKLIPAPASHERALFDQWMYYCMSELEQPLWAIVRHTFIYPENKRLTAMFEIASDDFKKAAETLEKHLATHEYMMGTQFSSLDVMIGQTLVWADGYEVTKRFQLLSGFPQIKRYLKTLKSRPAMPQELREKIVSV